MIPTTRDEFKAYVLRANGFEVLRLNISDNQIDDRIDEALRFWWDYYWDGSEKVYYKYQVQDGDAQNGYFTIPENITGIVKVLQPGTISTNINSMFSVQYQMVLNDLFNLANMSLVPYYATRQNLDLIGQILVGDIPFEFNRNTSRVRINANWEKFPVGTYFVLEAYGVIDPEVYTRAFSDRLLQKYAAALIKRQLGTNTKKYSGMAMAGGVQFNGQATFDEAEREITEIESSIMASAMPPAIFIG